jgi:hypothetical protein
MGAFNAQLVSGASVLLPQPFHHHCVTIARPVMFVLLVPTHPLYSHAQLAPTNH